jgi:hypothetical protein
VIAPHTSCAVLIFAMVVLTAGTQIAFWTIGHIEEKGDEKPSSDNEKDDKPLWPKVKNTVGQFNTPRLLDIPASKRER